MGDEELERRLAALHAAGASDAEMRQYVQDYEREQATSRPAPANTPAEEKPNFASKALGSVASLITDVPGASALAAGGASLLSRVPGGREPISYRQARNEIDEARSTAPAAARIPARLIGGGMAAAALPGGPVLQGAQYGALSGALKSDPDADLGDRARSAVGQGALGAGAGWAASGLTTLARATAGPWVQKGAAKVGPIAHKAKGKLASIGRPAPKASPPASIDDRLNGMLAKARAQQPHEVGSQFGDADIAMGKHLPEQDLEGLLRQMVDAKSLRPPLQVGSAPQQAPLPSSVVPKSNAALRDAESRGLLRQLGEASRGRDVKSREALLAGIRDAKMEPSAIRDAVMGVVPGLTTAARTVAPPVHAAFRAAPTLRALDARIGDGAGRNYGFLRSILTAAPQQPFR